MTRFRHPMWLLLCAGFASLPALAQQAFPPEALAVARRYSDAFNRYDCDAMLSLTSPSVTRRMQAQEGSRESLCSTLADFKAEHVVDELGEPVSVRFEGAYGLVVVRNSRSSPPSAQAPSWPTDASYVLHTADHGRTWYVLDMACLDARWIREVFPGYAGDPPLILPSLRVPENAKP